MIACFITLCSVALFRLWAWSVGSTVAIERSIWRYPRDTAKTAIGEKISLNHVD